MTKKIKDIKFALKGQEYNPKIKEGELVGIAIQTWHDYVWSSCGYLMVPNDPEAIQNLEKKKLSQEHFYWLKAEMRIEEFVEDVISDEGKKLGTIGKKKVYVEDPDWGKKVKLIYFTSMRYFVPTKVVKNEKNLLHIEIEPMNFYQHGLIDKLIFTGEKINQYRDLIRENLGKEFKVSLHIFEDDPTRPIDTNNWGDKYERIELAKEEEPVSRRKEVPEVKQSLEKYYQKNNIKMMKLSDEDKELMDIIFNDGSKKTVNDFPEKYDKQKFEQVKIILQSNNKQSLEYSELTSTKVSDCDLKKIKRTIKKWMEENKVIKITLRNNGDLYLKKDNGSGSILTSHQTFLSNASELTGANIKNYLQKIGQNSITSQELGLDDSEKVENQNRDNFAWIPWLVGGTILVLAIALFFIIRKKRRKKYVK